MSDGYEGVRQFSQAIGGVMSLPASRRARWRTLNPIEQNLQRASHGVAYIVLPIAAAAKLGGVGAVLSAVNPDVRSLLMGAYAVLFAVSAARFGYGWRRSLMRDGLLAGRAFVKLALGAFLLCTLPQLVTNEWAALALWLVALWLLVTGGVRLAALMRPAGRALPDVTDNIDANEFDWNQ